MHNIPSTDHPIIMETTDYVARQLRKKGITFEQVARLAKTLLENLLNPWRRSWRELIRIAGYHQARNATAYLSRNKRRYADST